MISYTIVPAVDITVSRVADCVQTSVNSVRRSRVGARAILKFTGGAPGSMRTYRLYTHAQILEIGAGPDWQADM